LIVFVFDEGSMIFWDVCEFCSLTSRVLSSALKQTEQYPSVAADP
jgi:predicted DsbA family dithiol-disulfide isomerase